MDRVKKALEELIAAIIDSEVYREYDRQNAVMREHPDLKRQIDEFRRENYMLQHSSTSDELFDKVDEFTSRYEEFRSNALVEPFLSAELDFCRMIQDINQQILEAVDFE